MEYHKKSMDLNKEVESEFLYDGNDEGIITDPFNPGV